MADGFIAVPPDSTGKKLDTEQLTVNGIIVQRERDQIAGSLEDEIAAVLNTDPAGNAYGLVVRPIEVVNEARSNPSSSALAAGASVNLDGATIPNAILGKLLLATLSSTVACKWIIKARNGGVESTIDIVFTSGLAGGQPTFQWTPPAKGKGWAEQLGDGVDTNFRVTVTNLDGDNAADVYAGLFWDEA